MKTYEYNLSTPWDITTVHNPKLKFSEDGKTLSVEDLNEAVDAKLKELELPTFREILKEHYPEVLI